MEGATVMGDPVPPEEAHVHEPSGPLPPAEAPPRRRRRHHVWIGIWLFLAAAMLGYFAARFHRVRQHTGQASRGAVPGGVVVNAAAAKRDSIGVYLDAIGTVTPVYTTSIIAQANGVVTAVHYHEGQIIKKGDPLIDIDPSFYQAQLLQAQGTWDRDTAVLAQSRMDLARYRDAWARNAIPRQTLEDAEKVVLQNQGLVKADEGALQLAAVQLGYCHIVAPISGRVGLRLVDPGNVVAANELNQTSGTTSLVVITHVRPITVIFTIAQDDLPSVRTQMKQRKLSAYAYDRTAQTKIATGVLDSIDNQIDTTTGTVKLRAKFENVNDALFPNQFVNTRLLVKTLKGVTLVPSGAIQHNGPIAFVYAIEDDMAHMRTVKIGATDAGKTVVEGIAAGAMVATSSFERLQDGTRVTVSTRPVTTIPSEGAAQ
jgi:membrane fusion protein, multidrug efflux system